jgi:hypothetical protein
MIDKTPWVIEIAAGVLRSPDDRFATEITQLDSPGSEFEQSIVVMMDIAIVWFRVEAQRRRDPFAEFPDAKFLTLFIHPFCMAVSISRLIAVMNIGQ